MSLSAESRIAEGIASYDPDRLRLKVVEPGADEFANGILDMLKPFQPCMMCHRSGRALGWYRLFAKIAKLTDSGPQLTIAVWQQLGLRNESEGRRAVTSYNAVRDLTPEQLEAEEAEHLRERGWTVLAPGSDANGNGVAAHAPESPPMALTPRSIASDGKNGSA
jgi:hypothetical protein